VDEGPGELDVGTSLLALEVDDDGGSERVNDASIDEEEDGPGETVEGAAEDWDEEVGTD